VQGNDHGDCLAEETLTEYLEGTLDVALKAASEVHLIACDDCRNRLGFFMRLLDEEVGVEETRNLQAVSAEWDRKKSDRRIPRGTGTFPAWFLGLIAIAAALLVGVVSVRFVMDRQGQLKSANEVVQLLLARQRPFESRMDNEPHLRIVRTRGVDEPAVAYGLLAREMTRLSADTHQMGRFYLLQKEFSKAIRYLDIAARESGATAGVYNDLGVAYFESNDPMRVEKANLQFQHALVLDPACSAAVFNLALLYERENEPAEAAAQWKRYLELDPKSDWADEAQARLQALSH
jgi:tetratricopeptide (TPR) repeat protein